MMRFLIENRSKIDRVRKRPNAEQPIKAYVFLMISSFAQFKHRLGKFEKSAKITSQKILRHFEVSQEQESSFLA